MTSRRLALGLTAAWLASLAPAQAGPGGDDADRMEALRRALWQEAEAAGVSRRVFDAALADLTPDPAVLARLGRQSEFSRSIRDYMEGAVSPGRLRQGRELSLRWASLLDGLEADYGVPRTVLLALWAQESGFGADAGRLPVIRSLATLAIAGDRQALFRQELVSGLVILERERLPPGALTGSWAGAMGQTQFMPSSFLAFAVDRDGDGHRDIWRSVPDVLASTANFMAAKGWRPGLPWGLEVTLPAGLDLAAHERAFAAWSAAGVVPAAARTLPPSGAGRLILPAGLAGPAFLVSDNFEAIRAYNTSDAYAFAIGHLSDRLAGGGPLVRAWPAERVLTGAERVEIHRRLAGLGFYAGTPDGKFGAATRDAVRRFQVSRGLPADGYPGPGLLAALRRG